MVRASILEDDMTPERLIDCLTEIGWGVETQARKLKCEIEDIKPWFLGMEPVPDEVATYLERVAAVIRPLIRELGQCSQE